MSARCPRADIIPLPSNSVLPFQRQAEGELTVHRHDSVEVEADMVVDRGHVAPSALQWMTMLQAPPPAASKIRSIAVLASFAMYDWLRLPRSRIAIDDLPSCRT